MDGLFNAPSTAQSSGAGSSSQATANFGAREDSVAVDSEPTPMTPANRRRLALPAPYRPGEPRYSNIATAEDAIMVMEAMAARQAAAQSSSGVQRGRSGGPRHSPRSTSSRPTPISGAAHATIK